MTIWCRLAVTCGAITSMTSASFAQRPMVVGRVTVVGSDVALGYSAVALFPGAREQFTDADGRFTLRELKPGRVRLTVKHIGHVPLDTTFDMGARDSLDLHIELSLVSIRLPAIHTLAQACGPPGASSAVLGAELAALLEQLKQNAEQNRLLSRSYPFEADIERKITLPEPALEARFVAFDTVQRGSAREWRYAPGRMLGTREYDGGVFGGKWTTLNIPELSDFADDVFLNNHCFDYGGAEVVDGDTLLRIDFVPAPAIHQPDVGGAMYLDPKTFQIRIADFTLVNLTKRLRETIAGQSVHATFKEALPGVPIPNVVSSLVFPRDDDKRTGREPATETQRTLAIRFVKAKP
jgi:hypothetical protein